MRILLMLILFVTTTAEAKSFKFTPDQMKIIRELRKAAKKVEIPEAILLGVCFGESSYRTDVTRQDGKTLSHGVCQVKLATAQFMDEVYNHKVKATADRLEDVYINGFYAAKYLKYQLKRFKDWDLAIDAYNKHNAVGKDTDYVKKYKKSYNLVRMYAKE